MRITADIFQSYLKCKFKGYLKLGGKSGRLSDYERMQAYLQEQARKEFYRTNFSKTIDPADMAHPSNGDFLKEGRPIILGPCLKSGEVEVECEVLEKVAGNSKLGLFQYIPLRLAITNKTSKEDKLLLGLAGFVLGQLQGRQPPTGKIIARNSHLTRKIGLEQWIARAGKIIEQIQRTASGETIPAMVLNAHCGSCQFQDSCRSQALEKDHLSLLRGLSVKEIEKLNGRGIFTVTQYAHTFRPRRARKRTKGRRRYFELQALAIKDKKVYLLGKPQIPIAPTIIYLDVEGDPDRESYYLIGAIIHHNGAMTQHSFWADGEEDGEKILVQFLDLLKTHDEFAIFHYGEYETRFLKKANVRLGSPYEQIIEKAIRSSINVLGLIYANVYFPTYSNGLKDIAGYLGFRWTAENASGIQSLAWRYAWERSHEESLKKNLIQYNIEDCLALKTVVNFLSHIQKDAEPNQKPELSPAYAYAHQLEDKSLFKKFGTVNFSLPDMEYINRCAYFDYQHEKVTVRNGAASKRGGKFSRRKPSYPANQVMEPPPPKKCPHCGHRFKTKWGQREVYSHGTDSRKRIDLSFRRTGVKRWTTIFRSKKFTCRACGKYFSRNLVADSRKYGHGLLSWIVYFNVAQGLPFGRIKDSLQDLFGLTMTRGQLQAFKERAATFYEPAYRDLIEKIRRGRLVHADETQVEIDREKRYVWVFTNTEEVAFIYSETREGHFLADFLGSFKGVLISDFYAAYDSIDCPQQKCLIHLIRDMNDDLLKNPFDTDFKYFVRRFSTLLRTIVESIDRKGLLTAHLIPHADAVEEFYKEFLGRTCTSEILGKYQKRLGKNRKKLFTFLHFDGVSWNNNNAEHAIKHLAEFRKVTQGYFSARSLKQYLVLLSVFQTCEYKGINFLEFLLSNKKNIDQFKTLKRNRLENHRPELKRRDRRVVLPRT